MSAGEFGSIQSRLEAAASAGDVDAMHELGVLLDGNLAELADRNLIAGPVGSQVDWRPSDLSAARGWYERAAEAGHVGAMNNLGLLLAVGWNPPDLVGARGWWERAAACGDTRAMHRLGLLLSHQWSPPDMPAARAWWEKAAEAGEPRAMVGMGTLLVSADPPDLAAARTWWEKAAAAGLAKAMDNLSLLLRTQEPPDLAAADAWMRKAAAAGEPGAMFDLGRGFATADPPDLPAAFSWWEKAALTGDTRAMFSLALLLVRTDPPDLEASRGWLEKAAAAGNPEAMAVSRTLLETAAAGGDTTAMHNLAFELCSADPPDYERARDWYEAAAAAGEVESMCALGVLLEKQWNPPDLPLARAWYEQAAEAGHLGAMRNLGILLTERWNPPDVPAAVAWWEKAALAGDPGAMYNIGRSLIEYVDPPDLPAGRAWLQRAAGQGLEAAALTLSALDGAHFGGRDFRVWPIAKTADGHPVRPGMRVWISDGECGEVDDAPPRYEAVTQDQGPLRQAVATVPWFAVRISGQERTREFMGTTLFAAKPEPGSTPSSPKVDDERGQCTVDPFSVRCLEGHANPVGQNFCGQCAASIQGLCTNGHQNPAGQKLCGQCQAPLVTAEELWRVNKSALTPLARKVAATIDSDTADRLIPDLVAQACSDVQHELLQLRGQDPMRTSVLVRGSRDVRRLHPTRGVDPDWFARVLAAYITAMRAQEVVLTVAISTESRSAAGEDVAGPKEAIVMQHFVLLDEELILLADLFRRNGQPPVASDFGVWPFDARTLESPFIEGIRAGLRVARFLERPDAEPLPGLLDSTWNHDGMEFAIAMTLDMWPQLVDEMGKQ